MSNDEYSDEALNRRAIVYAGIMQGLIADGIPCDDYEYAVTKADRIFSAIRNHSCTYIGLD